MADKTVLVRLRAEIAQYQAAMKQASASTRDLSRNLTGMGTAGKADMDRVGRAATLMAGGMVVGFGLAAKAAIDWESAWAGVTKTVEGSKSQMDGLQQGLRDMAHELPATHAEIAAVAEAAGALGVQTSAIEDFTRVMIDLGETTDVTADQAATSMAKIANIMGTAHTDFDRLGSTLVDLGNNGASTESQILELANRLAAAGKIAGLSEADVFAFASTLASVGVEAEAGGTALSKVFTRVRDAVIDGGDHLNTFAEVAGTTAAEFADAFATDPSGAIEMFIAGLDRMNSAGQSTSDVFKDLELNDERLKRALLSTAGAGELLTEQLEIGRRAWEQNVALQTEAEKRYDTTAAKLEMARNAAVDLGIDLGGVLLPALTATADGASTMFRGFSAMPEGLKMVSVGIGGVALGGLAAAAAAAILIPKIQALRTSLIAMGAAGRAASTAMPWLAAAAVAVGAVGYIFGQQAKAAEEAEERIKGYTDAIREAGSVTEGTQQQVRDLVTEFPELAALLNDAGVSAEDFGDALSGTDDEWAAMRDHLLEVAEASGVGGRALDAYGTVLDRQRDAALQGAQNAAELEQALGGTGDAAEDAAPQVGELGRQLGLTAEEAEKALEEFEALQDAYRASVDPLFAMLDAVDSNRDAIQALSDAIAANKDDLDDNNVSAEELAAMHRDVAQSAMDVELASRNLAAAVQDGTVSLEGATAMLDEWVAQGLITEEQAANVAFQFGVAAGKADEFAGDYVANAYANTATAQAALDRLLGTMQRIGAGVVARVTSVLPWGGGEVGGAQGGSVPGDLKAIYRAQGGPSGTDTVPAWLTPGEFVIRKSAADRLGLPLLNTLNRFADGGPVRMAAGGEVPKGFELTQAMHAVGAISDETYMQHLQLRLTQFNQFSAEWVSAHQELARMEAEATQRQIDAQEAAAKAEQDSYLQRREINDNLFELGQLSLEDHLFNLDRRMAREVEYSDEWMALHRERERVQADELARQQALADEERRIEDARYRLGEISTTGYLALLEERLAGAEMYSAEYLQIVGEIERIEADAASAQRAMLDEERRIEDARFRLGEIGADEYRRLLEDRLAATKAYSQEHLQILDELAAMDARLVDEERRIEDARFELGELSTADYLALLRQRLVGAEKYSAEYMGIWREIQRFEEQALQAAQATQASAPMPGGFGTADEAYRWAQLSMPVYGGSSTVSVAAGAVVVDARGATAADAAAIGQAVQGGVDAALRLAVGR